MKKPSSIERADASAWLPFKRSHCLSAIHLARKGQVGMGVDPTLDAVITIHEIPKKANLLAATRCQACKSIQGSKAPSSPIFLFFNDFFPRGYSLL